MSPLIGNLCENVMKVIGRDDDFDVGVYSS